MADKNVKNNAQKTEDALSKSEAFFLKHKKAIIGGVIAVIAIIALWIIIDMFVTPRIMGKAMGLNPAILLLSLSVWGALLGFIGLIIALPLTTLLIAYYQRYITKE